MKNLETPGKTGRVGRYVLISWVTNYVSNLGFLTCLYWIISIDKIPVRILLDVLFGVFRFSKASLYALASSFMTF